MSTYFLILIGAFILPFLLSFDKKVAFYKRWRYLVPAMLIAALIFIVWDEFFTRNGVWGFNKQHLSGLYIFSLPLEECLFFMVVPYACVFTYDVVKAYFSQIRNWKFSRTVNYLLVGMALAVAVIYRERAYPLATFSLMAILLALHQWILKGSWLSFFYISMLLIFLPFMIVNGLLTGTGVDEEVVWYNQAEIIGIRLRTIPVEDFFYGFDLILINISLYEYFQKLARGRA
jgi:lycopene cyclase domain-containing protein